MAEIGANLAGNNTALPLPVEPDVIPLPPIASPEVILLAVATIIIVGIFGEAFFRRTGIPDVAFLMVLGVVVGPVLGIIGTETAVEIVPYFAAIALILIMFDGGLHLSIKNLITTAHYAFILAIISFLSAVITIAVVAVYALSWEWIPSLLLGVMLGGSSSIIVFGLVRRLPITEETKAVLSLESALTDIFATLGAFIIFGIITSGQVDPSQIESTAVRSIAIGLGLGVGVGIPWLYVESKITQSKHAYMFTLAALFALFFAARSLGESGALTALIFGLTMGNRDVLNKYLKLSVPHISTDNPFHDQVTFLVRTFFFVFIGLLATIGKIEYVVFGIGTAIAIFAGRKYITDFSYKAGSFLMKNLNKVVLTKWVDDTASVPEYDKKITAIMLPRGLAAAVLSTVPLTLGIPNAEAFPQIVFIVIITTVIITTVGIVRGAKNQTKPTSM